MPTMIKNYPFTTESDYTKSSLLEFVGGKCRLKDIRPANATFYVDYDMNINGNWGGGVTTGTAFGGASVSGGKLDLTGATKYVAYAGAGNADSYQTGCIRFKVSPNYTTLPLVSRALFSLTKQAENAINLISMYHSSSGYLYLTINDYLGNAIIPETNIGAWAPISGTEYEFELDWDLTAGATRLFIDGVQFGTTKTQIGTRSGTIGILLIGAKYLTALHRADAYFNDVVIYSTVQHTANYTPGEVITSTIYPTQANNQNVYPNSIFRTDGIISFSGMASTNIKYIHIKDGTKYYYTGGAWIASDGTYMQANTAAELTDSVMASLTTIPADIKPFIVFGGDGTVQEYIDDITFLYSFAGPAPTINKMKIWRYELNPDGSVNMSCTVKVTVLNASDEYNGNAGMSAKVISVTTDSLGYWELELAYDVAKKYPGKVQFEIGTRKEMKWVEYAGESAVPYNDLGDV